MKDWFSRKTPAGVKEVPASSVLAAFSEPRVAKQGRRGVGGELGNKFVEEQAEYIGVFAPNSKVRAPGPAGNGIV